MNPTAAQINQWIREQHARLGINPKIGVNSNAFTVGALGDSTKLWNVAGDDVTLQHVATVTVMLPSMDAVTRLAHAAADANIAVDPVYAEQCARLDAELAEILERGVGLAVPSHRRKSTHPQIAPVFPHVMTND
jgi:hypothetical protein